MPKKSRSKKPVPGPKVMPKFVTGPRFVPGPRPSPKPASPALKVAQAAKQVADKCATMLKARDVKLHAIEKKLSHCKTAAKRGGGRKKRAASKSSMRAPSPRPVAHIGQHGVRHGGKKAAKRPKVMRPEGLRIAAGHPIRMRETEVTASKVIRDATRGKGRVKNWEFWQCAGPVRTGCGHSGSFVVGDERKRPGIRLRGVQPYPTGN